MDIQNIIPNFKAFLLPNFSIVLFVGLIIPLVGCETNTNELANQSASISIQVPKAKLNSVQGRSSHSTSIPQEITAINVTIENDEQGKIFDENILSSDDVINIKLGPGVEHLFSGKAFAGEELLYASNTVIPALYPGQIKSITLSLEPQIDLSLSAAPEGFASAQNVITVALDKPEGVIIPVTIKGLNDTSLKWFVNDIEGGNETFGTVNQEGRYHPPKTMPESNLILIKATPVVAPSFSASQSIQLVFPDAPLKKVPVWDEITWNKDGWG